MTTPKKSAEHQRLDDAREGTAAWKKWGPYLSERQWGTVREDYSANGDAWNYFSHDQAHRVKEAQVAMDKSQMPSRDDSHQAPTKLKVSKGDLR